MFFIIGGHEIKVEVEKSQKFRSKHSGKTLEKLKIHFQVYNQRKVPKTIFSKEDNRKWTVKNSSYYYTEGNPVIRYIFEIEEVEELNIICLKLNNLNIEPYNYYEEIDASKGDSLIIKARTEINFDSWEKIQEIYNQNEYFSVVREGISDEKMNMRFERVIWSKEQNSIKCALLLYENVYDEFKIHSPIKPEIESLKKYLIKNENIIEFLIELLYEKDLLTNEDMENILLQGDKTMNTIKFGEVENIDEFLKIYQI